jgi:Protein of unknown function (DUF3553)
MFTAGDFLRHRSKPDWGTGKVVSISGDKIQVRFAHGPVTLRLDIAGTMLEPAEAPASLPGRTRTHKAGTTARNAPCSVCQVALNRSRRTRDGNWKSCPECSVRDGMEHVFWPYPESFGVSQARISGEDAEGAQSHCAGCRSRGANYGSDRRSCGQFDGMLEG